ncbi:MAG: hypothetical protein WEC84_03015 [Candidatus Andersenbacteria bacterium]
MNRRAVLISVLAICGIFVIQYATWQRWPLVDRTVWENRITHFQGEVANKAFDAQNPVYSGHPGMSVIVLGSALQWLLPFDVRTSLQVAVSLFTAITTTAIGVVAYKLRPRLVWWAAAVLMLAAHPLFIDATPTNVFTAPLIVLLALSVLWIYEHPGTKRSWVPYIAGIALGTATVTRLPTTGLLALPLLGLLANKRYFHSLLIIFITAVAAGLILDPLLLFDPYGHIRQVLFRTGLNYTEHVASSPLTFVAFTTHVPLSLLSIVLGITLTLKKVRTAKAPPVKFIYAMLLSTVLLLAGIFSVRSQSLRYLVPIAFMWDAFLPLFIINLTTRTTIRILHHHYLIALLVITQIAMFTYAFFVPTI